jgi:predicted nucleic acid-binding Zn ribbon protein
MQLPPPINLEPRRECPGCSLLTPMSDRRCVHCGGTISEEDLARQRQRRAERRRRAMLAGAIVAPVLLAALTLLFHFMER